MSLKELLKVKDQKLIEAYQQYLNKKHLLKEVKQDIKAYAKKLKEFESFNTIASDDEKSDIEKILNKS